MKAVSRVLAIGAHPDDIELGCGGTIAKMTDAGVDVHCLIMTRGAVAEFGHDRASETLAALHTLGVNPAQIYQHDFPDTRLDTVPVVELIQTIEATLAIVNPDRVYTMFREDRHQDHRAIFHASDVACRKVPQVLIYETPSAYPNFIPTVFEELDLTHLQRKKAALAAHTSQGQRVYMDQEAITAAGKFRATQIGLNEPCEGFIPHKYVL